LSRIPILCSSNVLSCESGMYGTQNWDPNWIVDARLQLLSLCGSVSPGKWIESAKITRLSFGGWRRVGRKYLGLDYEAGREKYSTDTHRYQELLPRSVKVWSLAGMGGLVHLASFRRIDGKE
jgi:hypothetical protein